MQVCDEEFFYAQKGFLSKALARIVLRLFFVSLSIVNDDLFSAFFANFNDVSFFVTGRCRVNERTHCFCDFTLFTDNLTHVHGFASVKDIIGALEV